MQDIGYVLYVT